MRREAFRCLEQLRPLLSRQLDINQLVPGPRQACSSFLRARSRLPGCVQARPLACPGEAPTVWRGGLLCPAAVPTAPRTQGLPRMETSFRWEPTRAPQRLEAQIMPFASWVLGFPALTSPSSELANAGVATALSSWEPPRAKHHFPHSRRRGSGRSWLTGSPEENGDRQSQRVSPV